TADEYRACADQPRAEAAEDPARRIGRAEIAAGRRHREVTASLTNPSRSENDERILRAGPSGWLRHRPLGREAHHGDGRRALAVAARGNALEGGRHAASRTPRADVQDP